MLLDKWNSILACPSFRAQNFLELHFQKKTLNTLNWESLVELEASHLDSSLRKADGISACCCLPQAVTTTMKNTGRFNNKLMEETMASAVCHTFSFHMIVLQLVLNNKLLSSACM